MALRGLTSKDRADWEQRYKASLEGRSEQEKENAWINWNVQRKFGKEVYNSMKGAKEREAYWNKQYDDSVYSKIKALPRKDTVAMRQEAKAALAKDGKDTAGVLDSNPARKVGGQSLTPNKQASYIKDMERHRETSEALDNARKKYLDNYTEYYGYDTSRQGQNAIENVKQLAEKVSPYYRRYKGTSDLPMSDDDWKSLAADINAINDVQGQDAALTELQRKLQNKVEETRNGSVWGVLENHLDGFLGAGTTFTGALLGTIGGLYKGTWDYWTGGHQDVFTSETSGFMGLPGVRHIGNYLDAVLDNSVTRYADKMMKYGAVLPEEIEEAEKIGIGPRQAVQTYEQETGQGDLTDLMFNRNALASQVIPFSGYTAEAVIEGKALGALSKWGFRAAKGAALAKTMEETGKTAMQVRNTLEKYLKAENAVNGYLIPGLVGTSEGLMEGLQTKMQYLEEGQKMLDDMQQKFVDEEMNKLIAEKYDKRLAEVTAEAAKKNRGKVDKNALANQVLNELYREAWEEFQQKYADSSKQLQHNAAVAGMTNFMANSIINGVLNQTLQATVFTPNVRESIRNTRLGKVFAPRGTYNVTGEGSEAVVKGFLPWWKVGLAATSEHAGEAIEEYSQFISDKASRAAATNNLTKFLENKYMGDGTAKLGEVWGSDFTRGMSEAWDAATSKEAALAAWYGALGSIFGSPTVPKRTTAVDKDGKIIKDDNGKTKTTFWGRGTNDQGERESNLERIARIMPWRSGFVESIHEVRARKKDLDETAKALTEWIRVPENRAKYDGVVGTFNWAEEMKKSAEQNDEFGFRTAMSGKTINDAIMLSKLKGTDYYNSFFSQLITMANVQKDSDLARDVVDKMRNSVSTKEEVKDMTDDQIIEKVRENANKMLNMQQDINEASKKYDKLFGSMDDDTKESLIYGELQIKDWERRHKQLEEEIAKISQDAGIQNTVENSGLTEEQKTALSGFKSPEEALKYRETLQASIKELEDMVNETLSRYRRDLKDSDNLTNRRRNKLTRGAERDMTEQEREAVSQQRALLSQLKSKLKTFDSLESLADNAKVVLSEQEIMALDPVSRATMLDPKNINNYSEAQKLVINNIIAKGLAQDGEFLNKILDDGRISDGVEQYLRDYRVAISDPIGFNIYSKVAKNAAAKKLYKERYDAIKATTNYQDFARMMDNLLINSTEQEKRIILKRLAKDSKSEGGYEFYDKYVQEREQVASILKRGNIINTLRNLSSNDVGLFTHAITYLTEKGVNLEDIDAVVAALGEEDEEGNLFTKYVNSINADAKSDINKVEVSSIGETIQTVKEVLEKYFQEKEQSEALHKAVDIDAQPPARTPEPTPTPEPQPQPQPAPQPEPGNGSILKPNTLEDANADLENGPQSDEDIEKTPEQQGGGQQEQSSMHDKFAARHSQEATEHADRISSQIDTMEDSPIKEVLNQSLDEVANGDRLNTGKALAEALQKKADELVKKEGTDEELSNNRSAAESLRGFASEISGRIRREEIARKRKAEKEKRQLEGDIEGLAERSKVYGAALTPPGANTAERKANPQSAALGCINLKDLEKDSSANPSDDNYSPILAWANRMGIQSFLRTHNLEKQTTEVFFVTDYDLMEEMATINQKENKDFTQDNWPLIPVVKSEEGSMTVLIPGENGEMVETKVQPIGIMPSTNDGEYSGSARLSQLRDKLSPNPPADGELQKVIMDEDKPIRTKLNKPVSAHSPKQTSDNNDVSELAIELAGNETDITQARAALGSYRTKEQMRRSSIWKTLRSRFFGLGKEEPNVVRERKIAKRTGENGETIEKPYYVWVYKTDDGRGGKTPFDIWIKEVHKTKDRNSDKLIVDLLREGDYSALQSSSRITGYFRELEKLLGRINDDELTLEPDRTTPTEQYREIAQKLEDALNVVGKDAHDTVSGFIRLSGFKYVVKPTNKEIGGKAVMELYITSTAPGVNKTIYLGDIHTGGLAEGEKFSILKNLIMDGNEVRMNDEYHATAKWNVNYYQIETANLKVEEHPEKENSITAARIDVENVYDDGILEISKDGLNYNPDPVVIDTPYDGQGKLVERDFTKQEQPAAQQVVANGDNASSQQSLNTPPGAPTQSVDGGTSDADTGAVLNQDTPKEKTEAEKKAEAVAEKMQQDAQRIKLSDDDKTYQDGTRYYSRVTEVIEADEEGEAFDDESKWATVSSNVGTGVDEFVRDFVAGRIKKVDGKWTVEGENLSSVYPNSHEIELSKFADQLDAFVRGIRSQGITLIPRDVRATGTLIVTDSEGRKHTIDVAGTVDLIGYDKDGKWHLYDMKTMHNPGKVSDTKTKNKWRRQLTLYKKFLESTYEIDGRPIEIIEMSIIPIHASYPTPQSRDTYTVSDQEKPAKYNGKTNNQLIKNRRPFKGVGLALLEKLGNLEEIELNIKWEKMTEDEKKTAKLIEQQMREEHPAADPAAPTVDMPPKPGVQAVEVKEKPQKPKGALGLFNRSKAKGKKTTPRESNPSNPINQYVPSDQAWGIEAFEKLGLNGEETMRNLERTGMTEQKWNELSEEARKYELECKGVKK